ncbi:MAG: hypothetical protein AAGJ95_13980 [Cyanobacteria bacterium J06554_11]
MKFGPTQARIIQALNSPVVTYRLASKFPRLGKDALWDQLDAMAYYGLIAIVRDADNAYYVATTKGACAAKHYELLAGLEFVAPELKQARLTA